MASQLRRALTAPRHVLEPTLFAARGILRVELGRARLRARHVLLAFDRAGELVLPTFELASRREHSFLRMLARRAPLVRECLEVAQKLFALRKATRALRHASASRATSRFDFTHRTLRAGELRACLQEHFFELVERTLGRDHPDLRRAPHPILALHTPTLTAHLAIRKGAQYADRVKPSIFAPLGKRYTVVSSIAQGAMGTVYLGRKGPNKEAGELVVLKHLNPDFSDDTRRRELFIREAQTGAAFEHPNIVQTIDLVHENDSYFLILEYVEGCDLSTLIRRARRRMAKFSPTFALHVARSILSALSYVHATAPGSVQNGVVHRDITPGNILVGKSGSVKLSDFGIAKSAGQHSVVFKVKGTVGYMAPEQARGEPADERSDLFALGVILYELLTGERLYVGDALSTPSMIYSQPLVPPSQKRREVSKAIDALILRACALDPKARFQSAEDFLRAVDECARGLKLPVMDDAVAAKELRVVAGEDVAQWRDIESVAFESPFAGNGATGRMELEEHTQQTRRTLSEMTGVSQVMSIAKGKSAQFTAPIGLQDPSQVFATQSDEASRSGGGSMPDVQRGGAGSFVWPALFLIAMVSLGVALGFVLAGPVPS